MTATMTMRRLLSRTAMTILLALLTTAAAWADDGYDYIAADGTTRNTYTDDGIADASVTVIISSNKPTYLAAGWYVVTGTVNYTGTVYFYDTGETHLILADGCQMNIGTSVSPINGEGMKYSGNPDLIIYGQSAGSGTLGVYTTGESNYGIRASTITINGGHVIVNTLGQYAKALRADDITINGGTVTATCSGSDSYAIMADEKFYYNGGIVTANATREAIDATKAYYFSWRNPTDRITIGTTGISNPTDAYSTPVTATFSKAFTDGTTNYSGTLNSSDISALGNLAGKTLTPYGYSLTANEADGNRWTTFYSSQTGFSIETANAYAYTAEYDNANSRLTLTKLGNDIPAATAVIIVSATSPVALAINGTLGTYSGPKNDLHGVDVKTLKSTLGAGTFYVMGKNADEEFGFIEYTADYMPARKAYLLLDGGVAQARSLTMVFGGDETGIMTTTLTDGTKADDAWYTMDGRRLAQKPATKGMYINQGKKIVIK